MAQECIAKSKAGKITVRMKEKYGPSKVYDDLTVVMVHNSCFYLVAREGTQAVLPKANWSIIELLNNEPDEE